MTVRPAQSLSFMTSLINLRPACAFALLLQLRAGDADTARRLIEEALSLEPHHGACWTVYAAIEEKAENYAAAREVRVCPAKRMSIIRRLVQVQSSSPKRVAIMAAICGLTRIVFSDTRPSAETVVLASQFVNLTCIEVFDGESNVTPVLLV